MGTYLQLTGAALIAPTAAASALGGNEAAQPVDLLRQAGVQLLQGRGEGAWSAQGCWAPVPTPWGQAHLVVAQQLLALLLAAAQRVLALLGLLRQGADLQALLGVLLRQHLQLPLQRLHVRPAGRSRGAVMDVGSRALCQTSRVMANSAQLPIPPLVLL